MTGWPELYYNSTYVVMKILKHGDDPEKEWRRGRAYVSLTQAGKYPRPEDYTPVYRGSLKDCRTIFDMLDTISERHADAKGKMPVIATSDVIAVKKGNVTGYYYFCDVAGVLIKLDDMQCRYPGLIPAKQDPAGVKWVMGYRVREKT